jgi:hypothetical protein
MCPASCASTVCNSWSSRSVIPAELTITIGFFDPIAAALTSGAWRTYTSNASARSSVSSAVCHSAQTAGSCSGPTRIALAMKLCL